jgi:hypothetical protein
VSWYQLLDIRRQAKEEFDFYAERPPLACPLCGEPLKTAPPSADATLFCPFEGWAYPRDWTRP